MLTVVAEPADADLVIDDVNLGKTSREAVTVLGVGVHRLALRKDAVESAAQTIRIMGGDSQEVRLQMAPPSAPLAMVPMAPASASNAPAGAGTNILQAGTAPPTAGYWTWQHEMGAGLAVLGAASLVLGIVEHVSYFGKANDFKNAGCGTKDLSVGVGCKSLNDQFNSAQTWFVVGYVGAAVLGGAGAYFLWLAPAEAIGSNAGAGVAFNEFGNDSQFPRTILKAHDDKVQICNRRLLRCDGHRLHKPARDANGKCRGERWRRASCEGSEP